MPNPIRPEHPLQALESFTVPLELQAVRIKTVAELLDCEETIIRRLLRKGELRGFKLGRGIRVLVQSIEDYQQRQALPIPEPPAPKPVRRKSRRDTIEYERAIAYPNDPALGITVGLTFDGSFCRVIWCLLAMTAHQHFDGAPNVGIRNKLGHAGSLAAVQSIKTNA